MRCAWTNLSISMILLVLVASLAGCANRPRTYTIPQRIEFDTASGAWTVKTSGTGSVEQLPEWIGVFTVWGEQTQEGVWLVPDSPGATTLLVATKRGYTVDSDSSTSLIEVPNFIEPVGASWRIRYADKNVRFIDRNTKLLLAPAKMLVPVRRTVGERGLDTSIERQAMSR